MAEGNDIDAVTVAGTQNRVSFCSSRLPDKLSFADRYRAIDVKVIGFN